ncbi:MAG: TIGR01244 family phosphatase [Sphingomonas sp.]|uniref:TIGR01244 family sulfur transferase n=1 Tax=Sphingomonas sp. TaxID=28214 RepID=UPI0025D8040B|nr:TIGR01244 family sulfur transferase [Sphingomonas sp.]MBY0283307.1 TIGR01244 family phosphatase [Sphingomonas sp.]
MIIPLDQHFAVAPQITPADVTDIARAGYKGIINNRPEGEEPDQPEGDAIRRVAETLGLRYAEIPVTHAGFAHPQLDAMTSAMADGPVLAFCRSGTRSCMLWALASAKAGAEPAELFKKAAAAGYDLSPVAGMMQALAGGH